MCGSLWDLQIVYALGWAMLGQSVELGCGGGNGSGSFQYAFDASVHGFCSVDVCRLTHGLLFPCRDG